MAFFNNITMVVPEARFPEISLVEVRFETPVFQAPGALPSEETLINQGDDS